MVRGVDLPPDPCHITFVERKTLTPHPMMTQTMLKPVMVKVNGNWVKIYKDNEVPTRYTSWKSINLMIDAILDHHVDDHAILHKPFVPVLF